MVNHLRAHQLIMLEMLQEVDRICRKHNISYMLFAGTLLGAVRHQGFIPWDDDLDVVMQRPEYERFMKIAPIELDGEKYFLQREFSEHWPMFFSKLRKNNTACIERYIAKDVQTHQGVYIDIFPCDNLSDNSVKRILQFAASKIVIAKSLDERGYLTDSKLKKVFMFLCKPLPKHTLVKFFQNRKEEYTAFVHTFFGGARNYIKNIYPRQWFEKSILVRFEGEKLPISSFYDDLLTKLYGDYRTPLPESERGCKIHGEIVDLEHSYQDYIGVQRAITFEEYTRSIR